MGPEGEGLGRWDHSGVEGGMRPVEGGGNLCTYATCDPWWGLCCCPVLNQTT